MTHDPQNWSAEHPTAFDLKVGEKAFCKMGVLGLRLGKYGGLYMLVGQRLAWEAPSDRDAVAVTMIATSVVGVPVADLERARQSADEFPPIEGTGGMYPVVGQLLVREMEVGVTCYLPADQFRFTSRGIFTFLVSEESVVTTDAVHYTDVPLTRREIHLARWDEEEVVTPRRYEQAISDRLHALHGSTMGMAVERKEGYLRVQFV
jgi:hypothetical protein